MDEEQNQLGDASLKFSLQDLYKEWIEDDLDHIRFINSENKTFQEIRENHMKDIMPYDDADIVVLCMEFLSGNAKLIKFLRERIEDVRERIKKLS